MNRSHIILLVLIVAALAVVVLLIAVPGPLRNLLGDEGYKQLWQLSLASIVGGLVSAAFAELKREQDSVESRRKYLRTFHSDALVAYNRAKMCRRMLAAKAVFDVAEVPNVRQPEYETQMLELEDIQLQFESMKRQVGLGGAAFASEPSLKGLLKNLEEYLRTVLKEFENFEFPPNAVSAPIASLPKLHEFVGCGDSSTFVSEFSDPYDEVEAALLRLLSR